MVHIDGSQVINDEVINKIKKNIPGNFILFQDNVSTEHQLKKFISGLKKFVLDNHIIQPIISIDHEGGVVHRLVNIVTHVTAPAGIAATNSVGDAIHNCEIISTILAKDICNLGFNMNLAPVADVNSNPLNPVIGARSFGKDPVVVSEFVKTFIRKHHEVGILTSAKHFPGHGDTDTDSHLNLPVVQKSLEMLKDVELVPFQAAIDAGVDSIMLAHVISDLDPSLPASLSGKAVNYLRNTMNYDRLIISDCLSMRALSKWSMHEKCKMAMLAGVDICLVSHNLDDTLGVMEKIYEDVLNGIIPIEIIDIAVSRIIRAKLNIKDHTVENDITENQKLSNAITESSITILGDKTLLPVHNTPIIICAPYSKFGPYSNISGPAFNEILKLPTTILSPEPSDEEISQIIEEISSDTIIFSPYKIAMFEQQRKLFEALTKSGKQIISISIWYPYDYLTTKSANLNIITHANGRVVHDTLVKVFHGEVVGNSTPMV